MTNMQILFAEVYKVKLGSVEKRPSYLRRVLREVRKGSDDQWTELTAEAQQWVHRAAHHFNRDEQIPDFPDYVPPAKSIEPVRLIKNPRNAMGLPTEPNKRDRGLGTYIKEMAIKYPDMSAHAIHDIMKRRGCTTSYGTVAALRSEFNHTVRVLLRLGLIDHAKLYDFAKKQGPVPNE